MYSADNNIKKKDMKFLWSILCLTIICSCSINNDDIITPPDNTNLNEGLIKSYIINNKWEHSYTYNDNKTVNKIVFKIDGAVQFTESFSYKNGKIVESLKQNVDGVNSTKKEFEYEGDLIIKLTEHINGVLYSVSSFNYNNEGLLEKITSDITDNNLDFTRITTIAKLPNENKIRVTRTGVSTHIISYDQKLTPQSAIPEFKPIIQISNNGITGNILLTKVFVGNTCTSTVKTDYEFDKDGKTVINSTTTFKRYNELLGTQIFSYEYY